MKANMARLRVEEIAKKRGIPNAHQLQLKLKISPSKASRLWAGNPDKIGMDTIEQLCFVLKCSPNDLIAPESRRKWPESIY